jgi:hypothetical protein
MNKLFKIVDVKDVDVIRNSIEYVMEDGDIVGFNGLGFDLLPIIARNGKACVLDRQLLIEQAEMEIKND